jgi:hypothetical protein
MTATQATLNRKPIVGETLIYKKPMPWHDPVEVIVKGFDKQGGSVFSVLLPDCKSELFSWVENESSVKPAFLYAAGTVFDES